MKYILGIIIPLMVLVAGCIEDGIPLPLNLNLTNQTNATTTSSPGYTWENTVAAGKSLIIKVGNETWTIKVDYEVRKQKFAFFITSSNNETELYYEPLEITLGPLEVKGKGYFAGTTAYLAKIEIRSQEKFEVTVK
ncbi:hypothetical protein [Pyrococcus kukulkanii]|uniref:hypothetical protein n=1 Tax=Pyrococcus kukulkanii TaxID=1609559 RepID=UPI003565ACD4